MESFLSRRMSGALTASKNHDINNGYMARVNENKYNENDNEQGIINFGTAFSYICEDILEQKLQTLCNINRGACQVCRPYGEPMLCNALAKFFSEILETPQPLDSKKIIVINGTSSCIDLLAHCIADPGDVILIPTPMYTYLYRNILLRSQVDFWPVYNETDTFNITGIQVERALEEAENVGKTVRGLLLVNPNNPSGDVYPPSVVVDILNVCKKHRIHVIMDEIHSMTVFSDHTKFISVASYRVIPDIERTHFIWSFSKDFALAGARVAMLYSHNTYLMQSLKELSNFFVLPTIVQHICKQLISEPKWLVDYFFPLHRNELRKRHDMVVERLTKLRVHVKPASAGFVVMTNFSEFLSEQTFEAEKQLLESLLLAGIFLTPGHVMYSRNPGWFRLAFALPEKILTVGLDRIEGVLFRMKTRPQQLQQKEMIS